MFPIATIMMNVLLIAYCKSFHMFQPKMKSVLSKRFISIIRMSDQSNSDSTSTSTNPPKYVRGAFFAKRLLTNKTPDLSPTTSTESNSSYNTNEDQLVSTKESFLSLSSTSPRSSSAQKRLQQVKELQAQLPTMEQFRAMKRATGVLPPNTRKSSSKRGHISSTITTTSTSTTKSTSSSSSSSSSSSDKSSNKDISSTAKGDTKAGPYSIFSTFRKNPVKLLRALEGLSEEGKFAPEMALIAIRAFQKLNTDQIEVDVVGSIIAMWMKSIQKLQSTDKSEVSSDISDNNAMKPSLDLKMVVTLVRELCRSQRMNSAYLVCQTCGINLLDTSSPVPIIATNAVTNAVTNSVIDSGTATIYEEKLLPELAFGYTTANNFSQAVQCLEAMSKYSIALNHATSKKILQQFLIHSDLYYIRRCLRVLIKLDGISDQDSVQILANYFMQNCEFVKGAVSMDTLPPGLYPEVAFIGRSNVGKSSLLNMVSNRKGLAYVSKTPGKTSGMFIYFIMLLV